MTQNVTIIDTSAAVRAQIEAALRRTGIHAAVSDGSAVAGAAVWLGGRNEDPPKGVRLGENDKFIKPVRIGAVLDRVLRLRAQEAAPPEKIKIGSFELDTASSELLLKHDRAVRLTDKEKQILILLSEAKGKMVGREELLGKVWGYAPDLDTHTLETHIYRLRQKIENDPAKPEVLLTDGAGYKIL